MKGYEIQANAWRASGLVGLLNEVSTMLVNNPEFAECMSEFRYAMVDELRGYALMLADTATESAGGDADESV